MAIKYCNVPNNIRGESLFKYSWFVIDGYGFALHIFIQRVCLFMIDGSQAANDFLYLDRVTPINELLELDMTLIELLELDMTLIELEEFK